MAKAKKGKGSGSSSSSAAAATRTTPKCTCDTPFQCGCGNRPPRPSKGHQWDPVEQVWGGKGHKQKGGSGQTAAVNPQAQIIFGPSSGVVLQAWQRLPSQLLQDHSQRQGYGRPKYKSLNAKQYRVILPDGKGDDKKDVIIMAPVSSKTKTEEEAKEEACLVALLHITPTLPHERTLPEPFKSTWLAAIASQQKQTPPHPKQQQQQRTNATSSTTATTKNKSNPEVATASVPTTSTTTIFQGARITSAAQRRKSELEARRARNARAQRHEAIRRANQNPRVAMSAKIRTWLEQLLLSSSSSSSSSITSSGLDHWMTDDDDENDSDKDDADAESDVQLYVQQRLHAEGFTHAQARKAFQQAMMATRGGASSKRMNVEESDWDLKVYEPCLQWLLLHLPQEELPAGYYEEATEGHLEVLVGGTTNNNNHTKKSAATSSSLSHGGNDIRATAPLTEEARALAQRLDLVPAEAALVCRNAQQNQISPETAFWNLVMAKIKITTTTTNDDLGADCNTQLDEEIQALQVIFEDCRVESGTSNDNTTTTTTITLDLPDSEASLQVVVERGRYPKVLPKRVLLLAQQQQRQRGTALHLEIAQFLQTTTTTTPGEPIIFELYGFCQELFASGQKDNNNNNKEPASLLDTIPNDSSNATTKQTPTTASLSLPPSVPKNLSNNSSNTNNETKKTNRSSLHRPKERSPFWSVPSNQTPPATAFPVTKLQRARASLPAAKAKQNFLQLLQQSQQDGGGRVVLVTGETGCGKSTQIPQFILEEFPAEAKIVVCQPRRVAATGVATRVADERGEDQPGKDSVGYVVRGDSALCHKSRLVFCTTGVLLRQLQSDHALHAITHIVLDEVHERSLDMDVLLALLKEQLPQNPHLSVVLMSATLDSETFASYFGRNTPLIHIPGRTFPVEDFFLEDVLEQTRYMPPKGKKSGKSKSKDYDIKEADDPTKRINGVLITELVNRVDETSVDYKLVTALIRHILATKDPDDDGSILVFLPGAPEIDRAMETVSKDLLSSSSSNGGPSLLLLPLHGGLQPRDQNLVFRSAGPGKHKIIFSTNIAETSVTIPDCTVVIDCGREKQSSYDPSNRMPLLIETFCSKASLKQRRGRAGRVRPGRCFKLISKRTFVKLKQDTEPEILRSALDQTLLSLFFLGIDCSESGSFMSTLIQPPSMESLRSALQSLESLGAVNEEKNQLTPLGMHLAGIPAPPVVGKILILGCILGCRDAALAMGAAMSVGRSPLLRIDSTGPSRGGGGGGDDDSIQEMKQKNILDARQKVMEEVGKSDHAFLAKLCMDWEREGNRKAYCDKLGLSFPGMRDILQLKQQFSAALTSIGFEDSKEANHHGNLWRIIRAMAVAGMSPSQLVKIVRPATKYEETAEGAKEKEGQAQALKFFVRGNNENGSAESTALQQQPPPPNEERVFIHPSSGLFSIGNYSCPWLVYGSLVRTSKAFIRDATECNEYSLLLFGGKLEVEASKGVITIDKWCKLSASPKIGTLMGGLRARLDDLLARKVPDPSFDIAATPEMKIISRLIRKDGR